MTDKLTSFGNQSPMKVQCKCGWLGLANDLRVRVRITGDGIHSQEFMCCPICAAPFKRYPERVEHLWSDPY